MTIELEYLAYTAMLTGALWIPHVIALLVTHGIPKRENYSDPTPRPLPHWGMRTVRVHMNAVEAFAPFAALVLVAVIANKTNATTAHAAIAFFWLRLAHAVVFLLAIPYVRTVIFTAGFVCVAIIFAQVVG